MGLKNREIGSAKSTHFIEIEGLEIHYSEWGERESKSLVCCHGYSGTSKSFDRLASELCEEFHVVCIDFPGRGLSQWSPNPELDYSFPRYRDIVASLCDTLGLTTFSWVGISMGGQIGIFSAGTTMRNRFDKLILVDVGPGLSVPRGSASENRTYPPIEVYNRLINPPSFETFTEFEHHLRSVYRNLSEMTEVGWREFARARARRTCDGEFTLHLDPNTVPPHYAATFADSGDQPWLDLWTEWKRTTAEVLVLRGEDSTILSPDVVDEMMDLGPACSVIEIADCGHVPLLNAPPQIEPVRDFLTIP